jgi:hypothetical protein
VSPETLARMSDGELVGMLVSLKPSDEAVALLAAAIADGNWMDGALELRRRVNRSSLQAEASAKDAVPFQRRMRSASTIEIEPSRFRGFFWRRRMTLTSVGPLIGRCDGWASAIVKKRSAGYWALDELATALGIHVNELIDELSTDTERERLSVV